MKNKISLFILCGIILLGVCSCGNNNIEEEISAINCSALNDVKLIYNDGEFLTNNGDVYKININSLFSNNTNCIKINDNIKITRKISDYYYDSESNLYYENDNNLIKINDKAILKQEKHIIDDNTIISGSTLLYLKNDGKIYRYNFENYQEEIIKSIDNEKILYYIVYSDASENFDYGDYYSLIKTNKAYYTIINTNKEECEKYVDTKCEYSLLMNKKLTNIYDKIIYIDREYYITTDYKVYSY